MIDEGNLFKSIYVSNDNAVKLFVYLSSKCDENGLVKDNLSRICDVLNITTKQARNAIKKLQDEGLISYFPSNRMTSEFRLEYSLVFTKRQTKVRPRADISVENQPLTQQDGQTKGRPRADRGSTECTKGRPRADISVENQLITADQGQTEGRPQPSVPPNNKIYLNNIDNNNIYSLERGMGETFEGKPEGNDRIKADKKSFDMRVKDFYNSLIPYVEQYGREMVREFFNYWSEPNKSKTLMRWETEYNKHRAFDIKRRLSTWKLKSEQYDRTKINRATSTQYTTKQESRNAAEELFFELLYGNKK